MTKKRIFTPEQVEARRKRALAWYHDHKEIVKEAKKLPERKFREKLTARGVDKRQSAKLTDRYVVGVIRMATGLDNKTIRQHPEFIENYKEHLRFKRLIKQKKNENNQENKNSKTE